MNVVLIMLLEILKEGGIREPNQVVNVDIRGSPSTIICMLKDVAPPSSHLQQDFRPVMTCCASHKSRLFALDVLFKQEHHVYFINGNEHYSSAITPQDPDMRMIRSTMVSDVEGSDETSN